MVRSLKKSLPTVRDEALGLGEKTLMDPGLAARHGVPYVHLAAFAIDLDRAARVVDDQDDGGGQSLFDFGWEVFLVEVHLLGLLDPTSEAHLDLLDDLVESVMEHEEAPLGSVVIFAIRDAARRGELPARFEKASRTWKALPSKLVRSLDALFEHLAVEATDLAEAVLELPLVPPLAPPTKDALVAMIATYESDAVAELDESGPA